ncbi:MAG: hypothetical protein M1813_008571 [Trichoglossum hirsutum]|jgi:hypothetical protein|nr:MAG: hypothetical protein M1813_008571 [Trichoglossum hirsutum]
MVTPYRPLVDFQAGDDGEDKLSRSQLMELKSLRAWRSLRRWLYPFLIASGVVLTLLIFFFKPSLKSHRPLSSSFSLSSSLSSSSPLPPLLGSHEDPSRLWYPQVGSDFRPHVAPYNAPPSSKKRCRTPLFVAFTRNNQMLRQTILSYIAAGWPREDIIIVDNSGTFDANSEGLLTSKNPFFMDYKLFRTRYGVSILQTPTLLNFSQLMNFYLRVSIAHGWKFFFWSHMDVIVLSDEGSQPYRSFYQRVLEILHDSGMSTLDGSVGAGNHHHSNSTSSNWAVKFFAFDWLTLVNVHSWRKIGQWDTFIPYYTTDCDAYARATMNGFTKDDVHAGSIFDISEVISKPEEKFFPPTRSTGVKDPTKQHPLINSARYRILLDELEQLQNKKNGEGRNTWQGSIEGGHGEPWTYDPRGFQKMWWDTADSGRQLYENKWGTSDCNLDGQGLKLSDSWKSEYQKKEEEGQEGKQEEKEENQES